MFSCRRLCCSMFRTCFVRVHRVLLERPRGAWLSEKLQPTQSQYTLQLGICTARYNFTGIEIQTETGGAICVEERTVTRGEESARKSFVPKRTAETSVRSEFLKRSFSESKGTPKSVNWKAVTEERTEDASSSSYPKDKRTSERTVDFEQVSPAQCANLDSNSRGDQGGGILELSSSLEQRRQDDEKADVSYALRASSAADDGGMERMASLQASALLEAALDVAEEEAGSVRKEDQLSLRVAIVGAPNAGKSQLTNKLVGSRVSAVSRKTNTTHREHLGVYTKGDTQLCFYDTPGLHLDVEGSPLRVDARSRVQSAWQTVDSCEAVVVLVDAERQIRRPDRRVKRLVEKIGMEQVVDQKKILCLNKVDLIEQKRLLLPLAKEFENLPAYDRIFMISALTGSGVKDVKDYLVEQAIASPWEEEANYSNHRDVALEVVREQVFEHLHEELPHTTKQKLVSWKVLKDGSVRIQQLLIVAKKEHQKMLVGKNGAVIGEIGIKARKELSTILGVNVHLVLDVKHVEGTD